MPPKQRKTAAKAAAEKRHQGTGGTDGQYRMVIENKYKQAAAERKSFRTALAYHTAYTLVMGCWTALPTLLTKLRLDRESMMLLAFGPIGESTHYISNSL